VALRLVVDTDCGVDDALALLALLGSPEVELRAVATVHGTGPVEQVTSNVLAVLDVAQRADVPVHQGAARPLLREPVYSPHVHGANGLGDVEVPTPSTAARGEAIDLYLGLGGPVTLLTLGPLTNVALALAARPALAARIERIVAMGGALWIPGTFTPTAESNVGKDPEAAAMVLGAGVPLTLVPMDLVQQVVLSTDDLAALGQRGPRGAFAAAITGTYAAFHREQRGVDGIVPADAVAAAYLLRPDLFGTEELYLEVDWTGGLTAGKVLAHPSRPVGRGHRATVVNRADRAGVRRLLLERLA
jgi:inosine-uridine nucleoside N-ribohydrolase